MALTKVTLIQDGVITSDHLHANHGITTDNIGEGTNKFFTEARVASYLSANNYQTSAAGYFTGVTHDTVGQTLTFSKSNSTNEVVSLAQYIDDTNLARLTSGTVDAATGIATFTRDDLTTFTVDFSSLLDDTNDYVNSAAFNTLDGVLTLNRLGGGTVTVDLDGRYLTSETDSQTLSWADATNTLSISNGNSVTITGFADTVHTHDDRYYTEAESDARFQPIGSYAAASHTHSYLPLSGGTITSGASTGLTIHHDTFAEGLHLLRNHASNAPAIKFSNTSGQQGIFYVANTQPIWRDGTSSNAYTMWHQGNDGSGSGLDADTLDGQHASAFAAASHSHPYLPLSGGTLTGSITFANDNIGVNITGHSGIFMEGKRAVWNHNNGNVTIGAASSTGNLYLGFNSGTDYTTNRVLMYSDLYNQPNTIRIVNASTGELYSAGSAVITAANIGSQSVSYASSAGNASTLDGIDSTAFTQSGDAGDGDLNSSYWEGASRLTSSSITANGPGAGWYTVYNNRHRGGTGDGTSYGSQIVIGMTTNYNNMYFRSNYSNNAWTSWHKLWHDGNDGSGSGLDADTVDGLQAGSFLRSDTSDTVNAGVTYSWGTTDTHGLQFTNASYSKSLYIGGWSSTNSAGISRIRNSSDNLHLDSGSAGVMLLNHYSGGNVGMNNGGGYTYSYTSMRAPIFYDYNNTAYYVNPASTSNFNTVNASSFNGNGSGLTSVNADTVDGYDSGTLWRRVGATNGTAGGGWMTVAYYGSGRGSGEVIVTDGESSDHSFIRIHWLRSYADSNFTVLNCGGHANRITGARVLYQTSDNTYGGKYLQVYVTTSSNYYVRITKEGDTPNYGSLTAITPVIENSKSGYAVHGNELTGLDNTSLAAEEGIKAGGNIYTNSYGSADQWNTAYGWGDHASAGYAPAGGSYGTDWYANALYYDDWVRNHSNTNGIYWSTTGWHLYPINSSDFRVRSGTSDASIRFNRGGTDASYIHNAADNAIGFLNTSRSWSFRVDNSSNATVYGNLNVNGWTYLGNGSGDETHINDVLRLGATDSGDAHLFFGENSSNWYGEHWYWDSGYTTNRYSRHAGTDTLIEKHDTRYTHKIQSNRGYERLTHSSGYQIGSYNSVGANSAKTNPIYAIGDNYRPSDTSLNSMYGIGYAHPNLTAWGSGKTSSWGMYIANNGSIDATIGEGSTTAWFKNSVIADGDFRAPYFYNPYNTSEYIGFLGGGWGINIPYGNMQIGSIVMNSDLYFYTSSSSRKIYMEHGTSSTNAIEIKNTISSSSYAMYFKNSGNFGIGAIIMGSSSTTFSTSSDYRLKENVVPMTGSIERVKQLNPVNFNFIIDPDVTVDGFIAHEAQAVVPEAVSGKKDAVDEEGNIKPQGIDQSKLVPLLTSALQEAIAKIESLEQRLADAGL